MRSLVALFLIVFIGMVVLLCVQNVESVNLTLLAWPVMAPLWLVVVASYLLGMLSGWGFMGLLKRSWQRVTESRTR
jgi:uncharacterized integral membrane protein